MSVDVATELAAMKRIANTLDALEPDTKGRVLNWLTDRYRKPNTATADPYPPDDTH